ncbi:hypothetical protein ACFLV2_00550 [Chloroflexota bacterium]
MSRNSRPTTEELKFVYGLILKGDNDADILAEYAQLYESAQLLFPYRTDKRFIRERKKELEAAREVLQKDLKAVDPIIVRRKEEHFNYLAEIIRSMIPEKTTIIENIGSEYVIKPAIGKQTILTQEQLANFVTKFLEDAAKRYGHRDVYEYLIPHIEAEIAGTEGKGLNAFINENTLKFYETLRLLADKGIFKGKCPLCREM